MKIFSVYDRSAGFYFPIFVQRSLVEATRSFTRLMSDQNRSGAPSEYDLVCFGDFDDVTGDFSLSRAVIANGADCSGVPTNE